MSHREHQSEAVKKHRQAAPEKVRVGVLTISDTRTEKDDTGGDAIVGAMERAGNEIASRAIVRDEPEEIRRNLVDLLARSDVDAVVTTGGTGISNRDTTYEVVERMLEKKLDGFGELFRALSYEEIGSAAMLSRALAGTVGGKFLACLPGSRNAVELGVRKLLVPELGHLIFELKKHAR